jgi:hypothetical protein
VPDFILLSVSHLEANGLAEDMMFNCTDEVAINELERKIERGELSDLAAYKHAEVVAALIKRFLLRLPEPLMENHLLDNFVACLTIADEFELCLELDGLLHQMPCRELSLLRFLLAFVVNRAKTTDVPYVCLWRAAEQLGQCLVRGSDARRSAAGAVTFALLRLYGGAFEPPVDRVQYLRDPETDAFVIRAAQPVVLLRKLVSPIWQDVAMVRRILLTHPLFVESHTLLAWFAYELRRAQRALDACGRSETSAAGAPRAAARQGGDAAAAARLQGALVHVERQDAAQPRRLDVGRRADRRPRHAARFDRQPPFGGGSGSGRPLAASRRRARR